jgi:catechol 1,2-dioxygenase
MNIESEVNRRQFLAAALVAALAMSRNASGAGCHVTEDNPQGPFYLPGAPFRSKLAPDSQPGERLKISGRVLGGSNCSPLAGAVVDVWHASAAGFYYGLEATRPLKPEEYLLRGRIRTGEDGRYSFDSILPGNYRVNENWVRPRHIHYTVSHPDHQSLTTQLYFEGDPQNLTDPMVKKTLIIPLKQLKGKTGGYEGGFDIILS